MFMRNENANDYQNIRSLIKQVFRGAREANAVDAIRESNAFIPDLSLVFEKEDEIVGYILFSPVKIRTFDSEKQNLSDEKKYLAVTLLAVSPEYQEQGIGRSLVDFGLDKAKQFGYDAVIVIGDDSFYQEVGFKPLYSWDTFPPFELDNKENIKAIEFSLGALVSGILEFPPEFDEIYSKECCLSTVNKL